MRNATKGQQRISYYWEFFDAFNKLASYCSACMSWNSRQMKKRRRLWKQKSHQTPCNYCFSCKLLRLKVVAKLLKEIQKTYLDTFNLQFIQFYFTMTSKTFHEQFNYYHSRVKFTHNPIFVSLPAFITRFPDYYMYSTQSRLFLVVVLFLCFN